MGRVTRSTATIQCDVLYCALLAALTRQLSCPLSHILYGLLFSAPTAPPAVAAGVYLLWLRATSAFRCSGSSSSGCDSDPTLLLLLLHLHPCTLSSSAMSTAGSGSTAQRSLPPNSSPTAIAPSDSAALTAESRPPSTPSLSPSSTVASAASSSSSSSAAAVLWPPARGYPPSLFVDVVDDLWCCFLCEQVVREPVEPACGHLLCAACFALAAAAAPASVPICRVCQTAISAPPRPNRPIQTMMTAWRVHCPYFASGCQHESSLGKDEAVINTHLRDACQFLPVPCELCGQQVQRGRLQHHTEADCSARMRQCEKCGEKLRVDTEDVWREHQRNTVEPSLQCRHLRSCPNKCCLPAAPATDLMLKQQRPAKRRRDDEEKQESKDANDAADGVNGDEERGARQGVLSVMPHWLLSAHLVVCPLQAVECGVCRQQLSRSQLRAHFAASHPQKPLLVHQPATSDASSSASAAVLETERTAAVTRAQAAEAELEEKTQLWTRLSRSQQESIQRLHAARQSEQQELASLHQQLQQQRDQSLSQQKLLERLQQQQLVDGRFRPLPSAAPTASFSPASSSSAAVSIGSASSSPSPSRAGRLAEFHSLLDSVLCQYCHQPRSLLCLPQSRSCCALHHPQERMLSLEAGGTALLARASRAASAASTGRCITSTSTTSRANSQSGRSSATTSEQPLQPLQPQLSTRQMAAAACRSSA